MIERGEEIETTATEEEGSERQRERKRMKREREKEREGEREVDCRRETERRILFLSSSHFSDAMTTQVSKHRATLTCFPSTFQYIQTNQDTFVPVSTCTCQKQVLEQVGIGVEVVELESAWYVSQGFGMELLT